MSAEKINLRQDPSSIISSEVNDNSIPKVVDINHLLARVREKEKQLDKINFIFFGLFVALVVIAGILLSL